VENHDELAGLSNEVLLTIEDPDFIVKGWTDELLAVRRANDKVSDCNLQGNLRNGFIITVPN